MACYLVTGGAGFIGSHIVEALLSAGHNVRVVDNFSTGKHDNLAGLDIELFEGDIRDRALLLKALEGVQTVFHEAAFVSVPKSMLEPMECFAVNQTGTENVLESARKQGVKRVVLASSAAVYGDSNAMPLKEDSRLFPLSPYAVSKRVTEIYAELYTRSFGLEVVALRYFNVYGPRQRPDSMYAAAVPIFTRNLVDGKPVIIFGDGGQTRDLVHVSDIVRANLAAANHPAAAGKIFNVCTGVEVSINNLIDHLTVHFPLATPAEHRPQRSGDIYRSIGDCTYLNENLGFKAEMSLRDGLKTVVDWMASKE